MKPVRDDDYRPTAGAGECRPQLSQQRLPRRPLIPGIYVPTLCFFHSDSEDVDLETVSNHAVRLAQAGVAGITVHGSNGEAVHLSHEERNAVTSATRKSLDRAGYSNMPLMVGCSAQSTRETIRLCQQAQVAGGDYALVLTAAYYQTLFTPDTITQFYRDVADASPIPIVIYNYPGAVSGLDLSSDILISLSTHPNIVGCKFTCGNTGKLNRVAAAAAANARKSSSSSPFLCFGGSGDFTLQTLIGGGSGIIGGIANIAPKTCVRVYDLYRAGELQEAQRVQAVLARGDWAAIKSGVVGLKSAMQSHCGYGGYGRRPLPRPMGAKSKAYAEEFRELVEFERRL